MRDKRMREINVGALRIQEPVILGEPQRNKEMNSWRRQQGISRDTSL